MSTNPPPIPLPKDPRHQRFADLILSGGSDSAAAAYKAAGFAASSTQAQSANASRLLKRPDVQAYMDAIRKRAAEESTMSLLERRRFYARIVRTPITAIDPDDPSRKDHDLIKKLRRKFNAEDDSTTEEFEKLDPLKACELDTKAAGEDSESNSIESLAEAIRAIGAASSGPLPTGRL